MAGLIERGGYTLALVEGRYEISGYGLAIVLTDAVGGAWAPEAGARIVGLRRAEDGGAAVLIDLPNDAAGALDAVAVFDADGALRREVVLNPADPGLTPAPTPEPTEEPASDEATSDEAEPAWVEILADGPGGLEAVRLQDGTIAVAGAGRPLPVTGPDGGAWALAAGETVAALRADGAGDGASGFRLLISAEAGERELLLDAAGRVATPPLTVLPAAAAELGALYGIALEGRPGPVETPDWIERIATGPDGARQFIVDFAPGAWGAEVVETLSRWGMEISDRLGGEDGLLTGDGPIAEGVTRVLSLAQHLDPERMMDLVARLPGIDHIEPNWRVTTEAVSDDPFFNSNDLWGVYGDESAPANPYGSQAAEVWADGTTGDMSTVIGVIDTGIDPTHSDLYLNVWLNQEEIPAALRASLADTDGDGLITFRDLNAGANAGFVADLNANGRIDAIDILEDSRWADGSDTDGNGFADDFYGWDFLDNDNNPYEVYGGGVSGAAPTWHGTHVAGTIGAVGGNGRGVAGVSWDVQIMALRFIGPEFGTTADAIDAIDYFTMESENSPGQNFVATNNSWGGGGPSLSLNRAIEAAGDRDLLFVGAAGNNGRNADQQPEYPAAFTLDNVISVGAITKTGGLAGFSNYGASSVDVGAPGASIVSTLSGGGYAIASGTSMAAPHVAGALALFAAAHPDATAAETKAALLGSAADTASLAGRTLTGGRLDVEAMIEGYSTAEAPEPAPVPLPAAAIAFALDDAGPLTGTLFDGDATDDTRPALTGSISAPLQSGQRVEISEGGTVLGTASVEGAGWSFTPPAPLAPGARALSVQVIGADGEAGPPSEPFRLVIDTDAPVVTVAALATADDTPALSGTVDDPAAQIAVSVAGQTVSATNRGDGTWSLAGGALPALDDATYDVRVSAVDLAGNVGIDATLDELRIDTTPPDLAITGVEAEGGAIAPGFLTNLAAPQIEGTAEPGAAVEVAAGGVVRATTAAGDGRWSLTVGPLEDGETEITVTASDGLNQTVETAVITVDTASPRVLSVGLDDAVLSAGETATLEIVFSEAVSGFGEADLDLAAAGGALGALTSGDGVSWRASFTPDAGAEIDGAVIAVAAGGYTDAAGNLGEAGVSDAYAVDTLAPTVGVDATATEAGSPALGGTLDDPDAAVLVTVAGQTVAATTTGEGRWSVAEGTLPTLAEGTYDVSVSATDLAGNVGTDATIDELVISAPVLEVPVPPEPEEEPVPEAPIPPAPGEGDLPAAIGEVGTLDITQTGPDMWVSVVFSTPFADPSVVIGPAGSRDDDPTTVRVRNVTETGFEVQLDEWDYLDGVHGTETVSWLAVESGTHRLADGSVIRAGSTRQATTEDNQFASEVFDERFEDTPVVVGQIVTVNDPAAATLRLADVSADGFAFSIEEEELVDNSGHGEEEIDWIALSTVARDGAFVQPTDNAITHRASWVDFGDSFEGAESAPALIAAMQTFNGIQSATVRWEELTSGGTRINIDEEQSLDRETKHVAEVVGIVALETGLLFA